MTNEEIVQALGAISNEEIIQVLKTAIDDFGDGEIKVHTRLLWQLVENLEQLQLTSNKVRETLDLTQAKVARLQKAMLDVMYFAGDDYNDGVELTPGAKHALDRVKETALEAVRASK